MGAKLWGRVESSEAADLQSVLSIVHGYGERHFLGLGRKKVLLFSIYRHFSLTSKHLLCEIQTYVYRLSYRLDNMIASLASDPDL